MRGTNLSGMRGERSIDLSTLTPLRKPNVFADVTRADEAIAEAVAATTVSTSIPLHPPHVLGRAPSVDKKARGTRLSQAQKALLGTGIETSIPAILAFIFVPPVRVSTERKADGASQR